jgi:hypothetical protein
MSSVCSGVGITREVNQTTSPAATEIIGGSVVTYPATCGL